MATVHKRMTKNLGWRYTAEIRQQDPATGQVIRKSITRDTLKAATKAARAIEVAIEEGRWTDHGERSEVTLHDALKAVLPAAASQQAKNRIKKWMTDPLAERRLDSIKPSDMARWRDERIAAGRAASTIRNDLNVISKLYRQWQSDEHGFHDLKNPVTDATRLPLSMPEGRNRRLRRGEYARIVAACRESKMPEIEHMFVLAVETAMRAGELQAVRHEWIEEDGKFINLPPEICKNGEGRRVPLTDAAIAAIAAVKPHDIYKQVFWRWFGTDRLSYHWGVVRKAAGATDLRWHDLRHEATSRLFEKGLQIHEVRAITGHKTLDVLMRYTHLDVTKLRDRINGDEGALRAPEKEIEG